MPFTHSNRIEVRADILRAIRRAKAAAKKRRDRKRKSQH